MRTLFWDWGVTDAILTLFIYPEGGEEV